MFVGMIVLTVALFALAGDRGITSAPRARTAALVAAASALATVGALLHLLAATDAARIGDSDDMPPLSTVYLMLETISVPIFSFAAPAIVGATTRTLGNRLIAIPGVVGGIGYGLAGATAVFTPIFDFLFPTTLGIALWAVATAAALLLRRRSASALQT